MEVKVDPGSETNCIPLSNFRRLFPQLCKTDGLPKETALEPTLAQFEAYVGGIYASTRMDHHANSEYQHKEVSSCEVLRGGKGRCSDPDQPYNSELAGPCKGPMCQQGPKMQKGK